MKKKKIILESTVSIVFNLINILKKNKKKFQIKLLSTNTNFKKVLKQAKDFNVKNIVITNNVSFLKAKKTHKHSDIKLYNSFNAIDKIFKKKELFYSMISIVGIDGLYPCLKTIKYSKNIAIVNKESLICGWNLIKKELDKHDTRFIPIDSEHFSLFKLIDTTKKDIVDKIYITASGGPFLNYSKKQIKKVTINDALKHPNWSMGKKISIDSATMMNKVFEVIEAKNIFNLSYKDIKILIHQDSYIHAIIKLNGGIIKILCHEPDMKIPIYNSLFENDNLHLNSDNLNLKKINDLKLKFISTRDFPLIKLLKYLPDINSLYETVLVTINDYFVSKYLQKKINFSQLIKFIQVQSMSKVFLKFKKKKAKKVEDIYKIKDYVELKLNSLGI